MNELLEVVAHGITAVLATWLGLLVLTRARRAPGAPLFSFLCLLLVTWCVAIIVQRIGTDASVMPSVNLFEDAAAFLLPPATTHLAILIAFEGRRPRSATAVLAAGYAIGAAATIQAVLDPAHPIQFAEPAFALGPLSFAQTAWLFAIARLGVWLAGIGYLVNAMREAGQDRHRRIQLTFALATVILGVLGGMLRILPEDIGGPPWIGVSIVAIAVVMATYAILAQNIFLASDVAGRALRWSLVAGIGVVGYVAGLVGLERAAADILGIDFPLVTALALVVTLALFDPIAERVRILSAGSPRDAAGALLRQALGASSILDQGADRTLEPALARLVRSYGLTGAQVIDAGGAARARSGAAVGPDDPRAITYPLIAGEPSPRAVFGPKRNGLALTAAELEGLQMATTYLGSSLNLAKRHAVQASALADLRAAQEAIEERGSELRDVLAEASVPRAGLAVHALGSLRAELDGEPFRRWGGEKAGARQAEAVFAFLFDRDDQGVAKDEFLELIWPDVDLDRADVAFHRTMLGLRSVLGPGRRARDATGPITFANDRYRLDPAVIAWSDLAEFERLLADAGSADPEESVRQLEQARALYRGDYLDDCPFYGDSAEVEDRRTELRRRYVDLLVELGKRYAERGDRVAAGASLRRAQSMADEGSDEIAEALGRIGAPAVEQA